MNADLSEIIENAQTSAQSLVDLLIEAKNANDRLQVQLTAYKRKFKALEAVLEAVKIERAKDRTTIAKWRAQLQGAGLPLNEPCTAGHEDRESNSQMTASPYKSSPHKPTLAEQYEDDDVPTSAGECTGDLEGNNTSSIRSSPSRSLSSDKAQIKDINLPSAVLSQRVLPMSIGISDIHENHFDHEYSDQLLISSSPPVSDAEANDDDKVGPKPAKRRALESPSLKIKCDNDQAIDICEERFQWLHELDIAEWHPSDFKFNEISSEASQENPGGVPFHCSRNGCTFCDRSLQLLEDIGVSGADSRKDRGMEAQETPAGFWRVDCLNSSQIRAEKRENAEMTSFEGRQRLAQTLWGKKYVFRDRDLREKQRIYMN